MKPFYRFLFYGLACIALAAGSYFAVTGMYHSLYTLRSPLKDQHLAPGDPVGPSATRRVVFVLVDGLRYDTSINSDLMPTLAALRQVGASAKVHSRFPSYSQPGYSTLMTGAWPGVNDGPLMNYDYVEIPTWTQDTLFSAASHAGMKTAVSAYHWFEKLIPSEDISASFYTPDGDAKSDRSVVGAALAWLEDPQAYQFVLVHLMQVDRAGHHGGGPRSKKWADAARNSDELLDEILQKLDLSQDTLLISSDHGHIDRGGHGGNDPVAMVEPFVMAGAGVQPGEYHDIQMVDVAPTIATLLGLNIPASNQGQAQTAMLSLPANTIEKVSRDLSIQQEQMVSAYAAGIGEKLQSPQERDVAGWQSYLARTQASRLTRERLFRASVAFIGLSLLVRLFGRWSWRRQVWPAACAMIYLLIFNLRYTVMDGRTYSISSVPGIDWLIEYAGITAVFALFMGWLIYVWRANLLRCQPGKAAYESLRYAFSVIGILAVPALANLVLNGITARWIVPEPTSFFHGMLALVQLIFVPLVGLLLAGLAGFASWLLRQEQRATIPGAVESGPE